MNNIVLDVAIGLTFIYLLYSLLASTVNEFIAMILAYRHRMLEKAIEQMLDGKNFSYFWWDKVANGFLWLFQLKKRKNSSEVAKQIIDDKTKPNPIPVSKSDFFRTCYINKNRENTDVHIKRRKLNEKAKLFAANITNHPLYRRKSEDSFLYKKPAYLTASAFSDILFDILGNRQSEKNSSPILMSDIKAYVNTNLNSDDRKDLKSILNVYIEQANGDVQKFKLLLEDWYDASMNRVTGWYKRQATKVLFGIGLVLAFTFNISTIEIVHKLSVNKDLRESMAQSASNYVEQKNKQINNTSEGKPDTSLKAAEKQIKDIQKLYNDTIAEVNMMMGLGWNFPDKDLNQSYYLVPKCMEQNFNKVLYILSESFEHPRNWIGFLITALAITLGAPFWFDLLNKFVNIRAGGNKPSEDAGSSSTTTVSKTISLNQKPDPKSFA